MTMTTPIQEIHELRELVKETHHLLDRLKGIKDPTEAGTAIPLATPAHPWSPQEVREALGFDPNDPNVKVVLRPFNGVGDGFTATVTPKPEPADNAGGEQDDTFAPDTRVVAVPEPLFWEMVQALTRSV